MPPIGTFSAIIAFIRGFFPNLWIHVTHAFNGFFTVIFALWFQILDGFLTVITLFVSSLDLSALVFTEYAQWANLPPQAIYLVNQLALPQCASLISGAMVVRMLLNLIPASATRL